MHCGREAGPPYKGAFQRSKRGGQPSPGGQALPQARLPASTAWHWQDGGRPHLTPWQGLGEAWRTEAWRQAGYDEHGSWKGLVVGEWEWGPEAWLLNPPLTGPLEWPSIISCPSGDLLFHL